MIEPHHPVSDRSARGRRSVGWLVPFLLSLVTCVEPDHPSPREQRNQGFPLPAGAEPRRELGGATSLGPGANRTIEVFDVPMSLDEAKRFYAEHLGAEYVRTDADSEIVFVAPTRSVRLAIHEN